MLDLEEDLSVVTQAANGELAVTLAVSHRVDVAVLDLQMPKLDGIAVAEQLAAQLPDCGCIIVTSHGRPGHLKRALAAGVRGFLPPGTVRNYLSSAMTKLGAANRHEACAIARRLGWI
jgi:two-component system response regulator DesR